MIHKWKWQSTRADPLFGSFALDKFPVIMFRVWCSRKQMIEISSAEGQENKNRNLKNCRNQLIADSEWLLRNCDDVETKNSFSHDLAQLEFITFRKPYMALKLNVISIILVVFFPIQTNSKLSPLLHLFSRFVFVLYIKFLNYSKGKRRNPKQ